MSASTMPKSRPPGVVRVEPRLQARRVEVARHQGRRRLRILLVVLVVVVVVVGAVALVESPALDVDRVAVHGASHTEIAEVRHAVGIERGAAMVSVDTAAAEAALEELPWVERATVSRSWPATVEVALVERTPVAVIGTGDAAVLVDARGRALGPVDGAAPADDLPAVAGDPVPVGHDIASVRRSVVAVLAELPADLRRQVTAAHASPSGTVLTLDDGIVVRWGDSGQATAKVDALQVLLDQTDRTAVAVIDIRVPRAATVKPR